MADWQELTGRELDVYVARRLGHVVPGHMHVLQDASGRYGGDLPAYSTDLNAAITLVEGNRHFQLRWSLWNGGCWGVVSGYKTPGYDQFTEFYADTPALAICRAWLAYTDAKGGTL